MGFCTSAGFFRILKKAGNWRLRRLIFVIIATKNHVLFFSESFLSEVEEAKRVEFLIFFLIRSNVRIS